MDSNLKHHVLVDMRSYCMSDQHRKIVQQIKAYSTWMLRFSDIPLKQERKEKNALREKKQYNNILIIINFL